MNYFFHMFFFIFFKFPKAILNFSQKTSHASAVLIIDYSLKKNCTKNLFLPDDIKNTSADKLKSCHGLGKQINFHFSKKLDVVSNN